MTTAMDSIDLYMSQAKELLQRDQGDTNEFRALILAIKKESMYLSKEQRNSVLMRFFDMWDRSN